MNLDATISRSWRLSIEDPLGHTMPWELTIVNAEDRGRPLGERDDVISRFSHALPGVELQPAPGPGPEIIAQMPEVLREHYKRKRLLNASFEGGDFSVQFYAGDRPQIDFVGAEVRGKGNPLPSLAALCQPNGWAVINNADGSVIDLTTKEAPEWNAFRAWRDRAVATRKSANAHGDTNDHIPNHP